MESRKIVRNSFRVGKRPPVSDGRHVQRVLWYHPECMFNAFRRQRGTTNRITSVDDVKGFDGLTSSDQQYLRSLIDEASRRACAGMTRKRRRVPADNHGDKPDRDCKLPFEHSPWPSLIDMDMRTAVEAMISLQSRMI